MRRFLVLMMTGLFSVTAFGQQDYPDSGFTNKVDAKNKTVNGLKEGKWVEYEIRDSVVADTTNANYYNLTIYKAGKPHGTLRQYSKSGRLKAVCPYINGQVNGESKMYYDNGKLQCEKSFRNDTIIGDMKIYYENGKVKLETTWVNGKETGIQKQYYEDGKLRSESTIVKGQNMEEKDYYENGKLQREIDIGTEKDYDEYGNLTDEKVF